MSRIRFQADADLNQAIVTGMMRRSTDIDFQTATAANLEGKTDRQVFRQLLHDRNACS